MNEFKWGLYIIFANAFFTVFGDDRNERQQEQDLQIFKSEFTFSTN